MKLTLIRHGITEGNIRRLYYGSTDLPLLPKGLEACRKMSLDYRYPQAEFYYTSSLKRTKETLKAIYGNVAYEVVDGIQEIDFGRFEMKSYEELKNVKEYQDYISEDWESNVIPGGESWKKLDERAMNAVQSIVRKGRDAVCVTHGGVIGSLMAQWFPESGRRYDFVVEPGHGYRISFENAMPINFEAVPFPIDR